MPNWNQGPFNPVSPFGSDDAAIAGSPAMATFFNAVYGWMAAGLGLTALVAFGVSHNIEALHALFNGPTLLVLMLVEFGLVMAVAGAVQRISANVATILFLIYSALNGITLSGLFLMYANVTLGGTFLVTAATFGAVSLWGMTTRTDLTRFGNILFMALIGLVLASIVNIFFANSTLYWLVTYGGVILFTALAAYDTQRLKYLAVQTSGDHAAAARYSVVGALMLYLDFLNLFLFLLRILGAGDRRR